MGLHHQFAVIDNKTIFIATLNWPPAVARTNDEIMLAIHSPKLAAHLTREMNRMWRNAEQGITPLIRQSLES